MKLWLSSTRFLSISVLLLLFGILLTTPKTAYADTQLPVTGGGVSTLTIDVSGTVLGVNVYNYGAGGYPGSTTYPNSSNSAWSIVCTGGYNPSTHMCTITGGGLLLLHAVNGANWFAFQDFAGSPANFYFEYNYDSSSGSYSGSSCVNGTCINAVTPPGDQLPWNNALATSTTFAFGANGGIGGTDYIPGARLHQVVTANAANLGAFVLTPASYTFNYPLNVPGGFTVSTSTDVETIGSYSMTTSIDVPYTIFGVSTPFYRSLTSTTTQFLVATTTFSDYLQGQSNSTFSNALSQASPFNINTNATSTCAFGGSNIFGIPDLFTCIGVLVLPDESKMEAISNEWNQVQAKPPIGYVGTTIHSLQTIGSTTATTTAFAFPTLPAAMVTDIFDPIDLALAALVWVVFTVGFYKRLKHIDL